MDLTDLRGRLTNTYVAELCALAGLGALAGLSLYPVASAGFVLVDDHEILAFTPQALSDPELQHPFSLSELIFVAEPASGRVRPLYYVIRYAQIALLGAQPQAWHLLYITLGFAAAALLYWVLRQMGIARLSAWLGGAWLIVAPGVSSVWIRLGPQESLGTVLLLVAVGAMIRGLRPGAHVGWDWLFVTSAAATTLVKESFVLVAPAVFALRLLLLYVQGGRSALTLHRALWPAGVPVVVSAAVLVVAYVTVQRSAPGSYGGHYVERAGQNLADATAANLQILAPIGGIVVPLLVLGVLVEIARQRRVTPAIQLWFCSAAVVCLLVLPQLVLYHQDPGFTVGRYILPLGLGLAGGVAAGTNWLRARRQRPLFVIVTEVWLLILCFGILRTWIAAESFRADSVALGRMVSAIARTAPLRATIGMAADPVAHQEYLVSLPYQLAAAGRPDLATRVLSTASASASDRLSSGCADLAAIVVFSDVQLAQDAWPCLTVANLRLTTFTETATLSEPVPAFVRQFFPPLTTSYAAFLP